MKLIIPGRPITKKNHQQILKNWGTGKHFISQSEIYKRYEAECIWRIKAQHNGPRIEKPIHLKCLYWMPNYRSWPDLVGLLQATQDILQKAGIIANDRQVVSLDESCIVGVDKQNPRTEIEIEEAL